jgi:hypothetical protein
MKSEINEIEDKETMERVNKAKNLFIFNFSPLFLCRVGVHCGIYKSFIMYQIYHTRVHPLHLSPSSLLPHSWNSFNRSHFCLYIYVCTLFALYLPFQPFPNHLPFPSMPTLLSLPPPGRNCSAFWFSDLVEEKTENIKRETWQFC